MSSSPCEPFAAVDVADLVSWIGDIDFAEWPQQSRLADGQLRPAMVNDLAWHDFGARTDAIVRTLLAQFPTATARDYQRMLSVVMPGHSIHPHADAQRPSWILRIHVPLVTNEHAFITMAGEPYHLAVGTAYLVNTRVEHSVSNTGDGPRIHFMFDVRT